MDKKTLSSAPDDTPKEEKGIAPDSPMSCEFSALGGCYGELYSIGDRQENWKRGICEFHWTLLSQFVRETIFEVFFVEGLESFFEDHKRGH